MKTREQLQFISAEEMLAILQDFQAPKDLYNVNTGDYVFLYGESGSIAVYNLSMEEALKLEEMSKIDGEYWGANLGIGGSIYDDPSHEYFNPETDQSNLDYCKEVFDKKGWIDVTPKQLIRLRVTASKEALEEVINHLSMNGYDVKWDKDIATIYEDELSYIATIFEDRGIYWEEYSLARAMEK